MSQGAIRIVAVLYFEEKVYKYIFNNINEHQLSFSNSNFHYKLLLLVQDFL